MSSIQAEVSKARVFSLTDLDALVGAPIRLAEEAEELGVRGSKRGLIASQAGTADPSVFGRSAEEDSSRLEIPGLTLRLRADILDLATAPRHLSMRGWRRFGYGVLAVGVVRLADDKIQDWAVDGSPRSENFANSVRPLGQHEALAALVVAYLASRGLGHEGLRAVTSDAMEATAISAGLFSGSLKVLAGRSRPDGDDQSFPSGDATQAFAIASAIAGHSDKWWVDTLLYSSAGLVAWERVRLNRHWPSDVVAGALLGWASGKWVVRRNRRLWNGEPGRLSLTPRVSDGEYGMAMRLTF